jgi:hypothetical protein
MSARCVFLVFFFLLSLVAPLFAAENPGWKIWVCGSKTLGLYKGNHDIKTGLGASANVNFDDTCSSCCSLLNLVFLADPGAAHNMRTWFLTRNAALMNSSSASVVLLGFTWLGNPDEPGISVFGTQGFATNSEGDPPSYAEPFIRSKDHKGYLLNVALGTYAFNTGGDFPFRALDNQVMYSTDSALEPVFKDIFDQWESLAQQINPPVGDYSIEAQTNPRKLAVMDQKFKQADEDQWKNRYRGKEKKTLEDFRSWLSKDDSGVKYGKLGQFSPPGTSQELLWPPGLDANYFKKKKDNNPALGDIMAYCEVSALSKTIIISDSMYKNVLRGGWKVAPSFGITTDIGKGYTGLWIDRSLMNTFPAVKLSQNPGYAQGAEKEVQNAMKKLIDDLRDSKRVFVSTFSSNDQDSALKLEIKDVNSTSSSLGKMGDTIMAPNPVRCELTVDYQYNTPKDKMTIENASLVIVYRNENGVSSSQDWREVSLGGMHQPLRNYLIEKQGGKEMKNRVFFRNFDDLSKIQCIYGKAHYVKIDKDCMEKAKDFYAVKKRGTGTGYDAFTAPIWFQ